MKIKQGNEIKRRTRVFFGAGMALLAFLVVGTGCSKEEQGGVKAPGMVDGEIITIKTTVPGTIDELTIKEGEEVPKDKILVRVNSDKVENQLRELEILDKEIAINREKINTKMRLVRSTIGYLQKQVDRFRRLKRTKSIAGEKLESMELKLLEAKTTRLDLQKSLEVLEVQKEKIANKNEYLRLLLDDHVLKSPVNGVVVEKFVSKGEVILPGTAIADILDSSSLYVEIFIEGKEMGSLKINQEARIIVDGNSTPVTGTISFFGKKAEFSPKYIISEKEREALLYKVKIKVADTNGILKIGMPVTVEF